MNVKELIAKLSRFNRDERVLVACENDSYTGHPVIDLRVSENGEITLHTASGTFIDLYETED